MDQIFSLYKEFFRWCRGVVTDLNKPFILFTELRSIHHTHIDTNAHIHLLEKVSIMSLTQWYDAQMRGRWRCGDCAPQQARGMCLCACVFGLSVVWQLFVRQGEVTMREKVWAVCCARNFTCPLGDCFSCCACATCLYRPLSLLCFCAVPGSWQMPPCHNSAVQLPLLIRC